jgi:hypothetical protein
MVRIHDAPGAVSPFFIFIDKKDFVQFLPLSICGKYFPEVPHLNLLWSHMGWEGLH